MRKLARYVSLLLVVSFLFAPTALAQGPDVPEPPGGLGGIEGFIEGLIAAIEGFVAEVIATLPV